MRTTLTLDDDLLRELKAFASEREAPLKQVVNAALREGLQKLKSPEQPPEPFRQTTVAMGRAHGFELRKALQVAGGLEDEEVARKLRMRK